MGSFIILTVFAFPASSIVAGMLGYWIFKNSYIVPAVIAVIAVTAILTTLNSTFWFWAVLYTLLAFVSGLLVKVLSSRKPPDRHKHT